MRGAGCPASRLAVVARYGRFFASIVDGQKGVEFPGACGQAVAKRTVLNAFATKS